MKLEQMDGFEKELQQALQRRPAPPGLKARVLQRRGLRTIERPLAAMAFLMKPTSSWW